LIVGPSGAGKSDLALRCITLAPTPLFPDPAFLVADDRVHIERTESGLRVRAPDTIRGKLEVRGLGIVSVPCRETANLALVVELVQPEAVERMPDPAPEHDLLGLKLPLMRVAPFEASAPAKVLIALAQIVKGPAKPQET
jgi:HPr kinase/phosphorylase